MAKTFIDAGLINKLYFNGQSCKRAFIDGKLAFERVDGPAVDHSFTIVPGIGNNGNSVGFLDSTGEKHGSISNSNYPVESGQPENIWKVKVNFMPSVRNKTEFRRFVFKGDSMNPWFDSEKIFGMKVRFTYGGEEIIVNAMWGYAPPVDSGYIGYGPEVDKLDAMLRKAVGETVGVDLIYVYKQSDVDALPDNTTKMLIGIAPYAENRDNYGAAVSRTSGYGAVHPIEFPTFTADPPVPAIGSITSFRMGDVGTDRRTKMIISFSGPDRKTTQGFNGWVDIMVTATDDDGNTASTNCGSRRATLTYDYFGKSSDPVMGEFFKSHLGQIVTIKWSELTL